MESYGGKEWIPLRTFSINHLFILEDFLLFFDPIYRTIFIRVIWGQLSECST